MDLGLADLVDKVGQQTGLYGPHAPEGTHWPFALLSVHWSFFYSLLFFPMSGSLVFFTAVFLTHDFVLVCYLKSLRSLSIHSFTHSLFEMHDSICFT